MVGGGTGKVEVWEWRLGQCRLPLVGGLLEQVRLQLACRS